MHSRYLGYSMWIKSMAFIPSVVGFLVFFLLVAVYGRIVDDRGAKAKADDNNDDENNDDDDEPNVVESGQEQEQGAGQVDV
jgi:flagellar biosynthesis/type III secretory pathway M-ring protein FliF/YscJ